MAKKKVTKKTGARQLRVAVIGVGNMGTAHANTVKSKVREMKLAAVVDFSPARAEQVGKELKVPFFSSHKALIKAGVCDLVIIATPHPLHVDAAVDCMKAGLHVLTEKPLSERVSTADKMIKAAKKNRVKFAVMFQRRFEPEVQAAMEIVKSGKLGKIHRAMLISPEHRTQSYYDSGAWRATWKYEGGGVMMNQAPHVIDIFVQLTGMPESVRGYTATVMHKIEVEDLAEATMKFKGGGTGYLYTSTNEPKPGQMIELYGDKGKLIWRDGTLKFFSYTPAVSKFTKTCKGVWGSNDFKTKEEKVKLKKVNCGTHNVMKNFARHILYKEPFLVSGESGLASLELTNGIMLSAFKGKDIKFPISRAAYDRELAKLRAKPSKVKKNLRAQIVTDPSHISKKK